ncbi:hypothetical protein [Streptodolium elevatio]
MVWGMYDPVDELRGLGVHVRRTDLRTAWAIWVPDKSAVVVAAGLTRVQERCILAHQVQHLITPEPSDADADADAVERERLADLGAAERLVDGRSVRKLLTVAPGADRAAEALGVTRRVLDTWLHAHYRSKGEPTPWPAAERDSRCAVATLRP